MRSIYLLMYYILASKFPSNYFPFGKFFNRFRVGVLKKLIKIGDENVIQQGFRFGNKGIVQVGNNCRINENVYIQSAVLGNNILIAPNVAILASSHNFERTDIPIVEQGDTEIKTVIIEDDVWLGRNVIVLPGITIGSGVIVGAGSVVTKNIPPYSIVAGVPAKLIRKRN
jgi:acetyltransferase-like isoleucine patch superfamily enzyme